MTVNCIGWILLVAGVWIILLFAIIAFMMGAHIDDNDDEDKPSPPHDN